MNIHKKLYAFDNKLNAWVGDSGPKWIIATPILISLLVLNIFTIGTHARAFPEYQLNSEKMRKLNGQL